MCVIMLIDKIRPNDLMIDKAWARNKDGFGAAWREEGKDGTPEVVWHKGIEDVNEARELIRTLPMPFIAHFRVASSGGVRQSLTHPFPINKTAPLNLQGRTKGNVLFHNGDWKGWHTDVKEASIRSNTHIPMGRFSDTRAMAFLCSIYGPGFMELLPEQRGVVFGPANYEILTGPTGWVKVDDIWCSNDLFKSKYVGWTICRWANCTRKDPDTFGWCPDHKHGVIQNRVPALLPAETGGSQQPVTPFRPLSPNALLTVEMGTRLSNVRDVVGNRRFSKNKLKQLLNIYAVLDSVNPKKKALIRAQVELEALSAPLRRLSPGLAV